MKKILFVLSLVLFVNVNALDKSIYNFSSGVDGSVIQKTIITNIDETSGKQSYILASNTGVYIKSEKEYRHIDTGSKPVSVIVINDINKDNFKDIVYAVNSEKGLYNLVAVSGKEEKILWSKVLQEKKSSYDDYYYENIKIYKIEQIGNTIVVISDYSIYVLDSSTGKIKFKFKDKDNIWDVAQVKDINNNLSYEIALSNQLGEVKLIDSKSGKLLWANKIIDDIEVSFEDKKYSVKQNIWQVEFYKDNIYALGENGNLYLINYKTGELKKKLELIEVNKDLLNRYYYSESYPYGNEVNPTNKNTEYYKNFEMQIDKDKIIIKAYFNSIERDKAYSFNPRMITVDLNDFRELNNVEVPNVKLVNNEPLDMGTYFLVPLNIKDGYLIIGKYEYETKLKVSETKVFIGNFISSENKNSIYMTSTKEGVLVEQVGLFSVILDSNYSKVLINNNSYSFPEIINVSNQNFYASYKTNGIVYKLSKYESLDSTVSIWDYIIPEEIKNNGLFSISMSQDFNKDGKQDISALLNSLDEDNKVISTYILIIDSVNGKVINFKNIKTGQYVKDGKTIPTYFIGNNMKAIKDMNYDGVSELLIDSNIINGSNIALYGVLNSYLDVQSSKLFGVGDINNDTIDDLVAIEASQAFLFTSKISGNIVSYVKNNKKITYAKDVLNTDYSVLIPDLNNDGIHEIIINDRNKDNKQVYRAISGKDLSDLFIMENINFYGFPYMFLDYDINDDGFNEFVEMTGDLNFNFFSGKDGSIIYKIENNSKEHSKGNSPEPRKEIYIEDSMIYQEGVVMFNYDSKNQTVIVGSDINKDGKKEIFILKEEYYPQSKVILEIYDINKKSNTPIRTTEIFFDSNFQNIYDEKMQNDENFYAKNIIEVLDSDCLFIIKPPGNTSVIYDSSKDQILSEINTFFTEAIKVKDNIIFGIGPNKSPLNIDFYNDFKVENVKKDKTYKSPLEIKLNKSEKEDMRVVRIYNQGVLLSTEYDDNFDLVLKRGEYDLVFKSTDIWGKTQNYEIPIKIEKTNPYIILMLFLFSSLLVLLIFLSFGHKLKRSKYLRRIYG